MKANIQYKCKLMQCCDSMYYDYELIIRYKGFINDTYIKGKIKKNTSESFSSDLNVYSGKIYNIAASILEPIEKIFPPHFGLSELIVIQKV